MRWLLFIVWLLFCQQSSAQDYIFKKNNSKIKARVTEINTKEIKYISLPDSIPAKIPKHEVAIIIYNNGSSEVIYTNPEPEPVYHNLKDIERLAHYQKRRIHDSIKKTHKIADKEITLKRKNSVCLNLFEFVDASIGISYSRNFLKNRIFIHIPLSIGYDAPFFSNGMLSETKIEYKMYAKQIDAGLGMNYYLYHSYYNSPFIGVMFRYTRFDGEFNWHAYNNDFTLDKYNYLMTLGIRLRSTSGLTFSPSIHYGIYKNHYLNPAKVEHYDVLSKYNSGLTFNLSVLLGYSF